MHLPGRQDPLLPSSQTVVVFIQEWISNSVNSLFCLDGNIIFLFNCLYTKLHFWNHKCSANLMIPGGKPPLLIIHFPFF